MVAGNRRVSRGLQSPGAQSVRTPSETNAMHADTPHADSSRAPFARIRLVHMIAPVAVSIGLVVGGYSVLTDLADEIASTVRPLESESTTPAVEPVTSPVTATTIAAN